MTSLEPRLPSISRRHAVGLALGAALALPFARTAAQGQTSYTFLVLGIDTREDNTDQRSDTIMVSRVNVDAATVRTLSIPRDLWVEIPGYGSAKINAAYQYGLEASNVDWRAAATLTRDTITHNFGVAIDGFAVTDMNRFPAVIDAVGGIDVINPYDLGEPDAATNLIYPEGPLHLNGDQALLYCRLRHQDGDGARVMRQHLVLQALLAKLQTPELLPKLPELVSSLSNSVRTDIPAATQAQLMALLPKLTPESLAFTNIEPLLSAGTSSGGAWIYVGDFSTLPAYVQGWLDGTVS
jgi:polyisoprenyl-teichoic acid--peptidoglycan teichoic acid transferase